MIQPCLQAVLNLSLLLVLVVCFPIQASGQLDQDTVDPKLRTEVEAFMESMRLAFHSGEIDDPSEFFDHEKMISAAENTEMFSFGTKLPREDFTRGFESRIDLTMTAWSQMLSWDKLEIRHIQSINEKTVVVTARQWSNENQAYSKCQWWLSRSAAADDWRFFDLKDLDINVRTSTMVALAVRASMQTEQDSWLEPMLEITSLIQEFGSVEETLATMDDVEDKLKQLTDDSTPPEIRRFGLTLLILKQMAGEDRLDEALQTIDELGKADPDSVLRFYLQGGVFAEQGENEKALQAFEKYAETYGWEADVCESVADVYLDMDNHTRSAEFALKGLQDNKDALGCLLSLLVALPEDQKSQIDQHLTNIDNDIEALELAIDYSIEIADLKSARHVYGLLQKHHPDSKLINYYQAQFDQ